MILVIAILIVYAYNNTGRYGGETTDYGISGYEAQPHEDEEAGYGDSIGRSALMNAV